MVYCTSSTRTTTTNNDDDTGKTIQSIDGNSGVVKLESIDFIDPPLSQPEASCSQSRNGWVHVGTLTFNNEGVPAPSLGIRILYCEDYVQFMCS